MNRGGRQAYLRPMNSNRDALEKAILAEFANSKWEASKTLEALLGAGAKISSYENRADFAYHLSMAMLRVTVEAKS